jgi:hypothetical protein
LPINITHAISNVKIDNNGRFIVAELTINNTSYWLFNCYSPNTTQPAQQAAWLAEIQTHLDAASGSNLIIGGRP